MVNLVHVEGLPNLRGFLVPQYLFHQYFYREFLVHVENPTKLSQEIMVHVENPTNLRQEMYLKLDLDRDSRHHRFQIL